MLLAAKYKYPILRNVICVWYGLKELGCLAADRSFRDAGHRAMSLQLPHSLYAL